VPRSYKEENWGNQIIPAKEVVKRGFERLKLKISALRSRYQGMAGEDTGSYKRLNGCCGDL
jgi:hypothetical protein